MEVACCVGVGELEDWGGSCGRRDGARPQDELVQGSATVKDVIP